MCLVAVHTSIFNASCQDFFYYISVQTFFVSFINFHQQTFLATLNLIVIHLSINKHHHEGFKGKKRIMHDSMKMLVHFRQTQTNFIKKKSWIYLFRGNWGVEWWSLTLRIFTGGLRATSNYPGILIQDLFILKN